MIKEARVEDFDKFREDTKVKPIFHETVATSLNNQIKTLTYWQSIRQHLCFIPLKAFSAPDDTKQTLATSITTAFDFPWAEPRDVIGPGWKWPITFQSLDVNVKVRQYRREVSHFYICIVKSVPCHSFVLFFAACFALKGNNLSKYVLFNGFKIIQNYTCRPKLKKFALKRPVDVSNLENDCVCVSACVSIQIHSYIQLSS